MLSALANAGLSLLGSVSNWGLGMISSAVSSKRQYKYQKKLAEQQFEYNKTMMQNRHQWEVNDLRSAGLNPILSAGGGGAAGSTGSGGSVSAPAPEFDWDPLSAIQLSDQMKTSKASRDLQRSEASLRRADAYLRKNEALVSAEKLKQEKMKTDYIKRDKHFFTPRRNWWDMLRIMPSVSPAELERKVREQQSLSPWGRKVVDGVVNSAKNFWEWNKSYTPANTVYKKVIHHYYNSSKSDSKSYPIELERR